MQKSEAEGEGIPLSVQAKLSKCNVKLAITLISKMNEEEGKPWNDAAHLQKFSISGGAYLICHHLDSEIYIRTKLTYDHKLVYNLYCLISEFSTIRWYVILCVFTL